MSGIFKKLRKKITNWCVDAQVITIGELHAKNSPSQCEIYDGADLKFIEQTNITDTYVKTDVGVSPIKHSMKTVAYDVWELKTTTHELYAADRHIVITSDGKEVYIQDLQIGDVLNTEAGPEPVVSVRKLDISEQMYDLHLDDTRHLYYTNGILSHNSTVSAIYLLWFAMFHEDKTILIASNKNRGAMEMIARIRFAYEELPIWLKPGIKDDMWNKHACGFDNGSKIESTATTESSGRGMSISLLFLDEFAFVKPIVQEEFWTSILPTLSTGGSCIMSSTPNGDANLFAQLWRQSLNKSAGSDDIPFVPIHVKWDRPPGRDEEFKQKQIKLLGELKWRQEYECEFLSSDALLIDSAFLLGMQPGQVINESRDFKFWAPIYPENAYIVTVDPATGSGCDYSVIDVYHFPSLVQVAQLRANDLSSPQLYTRLKWVLKGLENKSCEVYFTIENNGVGEGLIALYEADEAPPQEAMFIGDGGKRLGMTTLGRSKLRSCIVYKELVEGGHVKINSPQTILELKTYVRKAGSYQAQVGATDDCVSAGLLLGRVLHEISAYEEDAFDKMYRVDDHGEVYHIADADVRHNEQFA